MIVIEVDADAVRISNPLRRASGEPAGSGTGLRNLAERCQLLLGKDIEIKTGVPGGRFEVVVPLGEAKSLSSSAA